MKNTLFVLLALFVHQTTFAEDLSFAFEGDAKVRERLAPLLDKSSKPDWVLTDWANSPELSLAKLKGKFVVVDFWATWCGPCIASIEKNNEIHRKYKDDVVFIGICHFRGSEQMKDVIQKEKIEYPVAIDKDNLTSSAYKVNGYPDYYIFDREGALILADCANDKVEEVLQKLVKK